MNTLLKEFKDLLEERGGLLKDELKDHYLVPSNAVLESNPHICNEIYEDQTVLMMVVKKIIRHKCHPIRHSNLEMLALNITEFTNPEKLNYQDRDGNSVIHYTCLMESFSVGVLAIMQECGADFSLVNKRGETPLMLVANSMSLDDLKFIHAYTRKDMINAQDRNGHTALMKAVRGRKADNVLFLLDNGADLYVKDFSGLTISQWLHSKEIKGKVNPVFWEEIEYLLKRYENINPQFKD